MNVFQLVLKQMRQRSLSTWLTLLSVLLGVGLAASILMLRREGRSLFGQSDYGFDVVVGAKGSKLQLVLNTVYQVQSSPGNIPYSLYEQMTQGSVQDNPLRRDVRLAVPMTVGDNFKGFRVVGTTPAMFGYDEAGDRLPDDRAFQYRLGRRFQFAQGTVFNPEMYQAVIGSETARITGLKVGDTFQVAHGLAVEPNPDIHPQHWRVVGILDKTHTANDRLLFIPLLSFYSISEHESGLMDIAALRRGQTLPSAQGQAEGQGNSGRHDHAATTQADGMVHLVVPKKDWMLSAILIRSRGGNQAQDLMWRINNGDIATAANPATEMWQFFKQFLDVNFALLFYIALLVTVVAAVSILVSIYNSISARNREIAILRALGATRLKIVTLICLEAGLIGLVGAILGLILGHLILGSIASAYLQRYVGQGINWWTPGPEEWAYLVIVVLIAILAGLVPALKAYRTPVAANLVAA